MQVGRIDSTHFTGGVYFSKASNICFDKSADFVTDKLIVKVSEGGYKYCEDIATPKYIKDKFIKNEFIEKLAKKFDTFIWFRQIDQNAKMGNESMAVAKIWWADPSKQMAQSKDIIGTSKKSSEEALDLMFEKLQ